MENLWTYKTSPTKHNSTYHATLATRFRTKSPLQAYNMPASSKSKRSASNPRRNSKTFFNTTQIPDYVNEHGILNQRNSDKLGRQTTQARMALNCSGRKIEDVASNHVQLRTIGSTKEYMTSNRKVSPSPLPHRATEDVMRAYGAFMGHTRSISSRRQQTPTGSKFRSIKETSFHETSLRSRSRQRREHNKTIIEAKIPPQSRRTISKDNESISKELEANTWLKQQLMKKAKNRTISEAPILSTKDLVTPQLNLQMKSRQCSHIHKTESQKTDYYGLAKANPEGHKKTYHPLATIQRQKTVIHPKNNSDIPAKEPELMHINSNKLLGKDEHKISHPVPPIKPPKGTRPAQLGRTHKILDRQKTVSPSMHEEKTTLGCSKPERQSSRNQIIDITSHHPTKPIEKCRIPMETFAVKNNSETNSIPEDLTIERENSELDIEKKDDCDSVLIDSRDSSRSLASNKSPRSNTAYLPLKKHPLLEIRSYKSGKSPFSEIMDSSISEYLGNNSYSQNSRTVYDTAEIKTKLHMLSETGNSKGIALSIAQCQSSHKFLKADQIDDSIIQIASSLESYESIDEDKCKAIKSIFTHNY